MNKNNKKLKLQLINNNKISKILSIKAKIEKIQNKILSLYRIYMIQKLNYRFKTQSKKKGQIVFLSFLNKIQSLKPTKIKIKIK